MNEVDHTSRQRIQEALSAQLELLSGGASGASTYRVHGLTEPCVLKMIDTPRMLASSIDESGGCGLLIAAYEPMPSAKELHDDVFTEIVKQLAVFHAMHWDQTVRLAQLSWLQTPKILDLSNDVRHASKTWRALAQRAQFRELLTDSTLHEIESALHMLKTTPEYGPETALTLCHGDCHLENLLRDRQGSLIWADWQEVRIGHGPSDLTFLIQRAEADGAKIPHDIVVAAYCKGLEAAGVQGVCEDAVKSAMYESERRTRLLYWPAHMSDATLEAMTRHLQRIFSASKPSVEPS
jgi:thiamine kinase-like enzyme